MHIGGTQMASALNMDEGSNTRTQADSTEKREEEERENVEGRSIK